MLQIDIRDVVGENLDVLIELYVTKTALCKVVQFRFRAIRQDDYVRRKTDLTSQLLDRVVDVVTTSVLAQRVHIVDVFQLQHFVQCFVQMAVSVMKKRWNYFLLAALWNYFLILIERGMKTCVYE